MALLKTVKKFLGKKSTQLSEIEHVQRALEDHNAWHACDKLSILRRASMAIAGAYMIDNGEFIAIPAIHLGQYQGKSCGEVLQGFNRDLNIHLCTASQGRPLDEIDIDRLARRYLSLLRTVHSILTKPLHTLPVRLPSQQGSTTGTRARGTFQPCYNTPRLQMSPLVEMYSAPRSRPGIYTPSRWTGTVRSMTALEGLKEDELVQPKPNYMMSTSGFAPMHAPPTMGRKSTSSWMSSGSSATSSSKSSHGFTAPPLQLQGGRN